MDIIKSRREGRTKIIDQLVGTIKSAFSAYLNIDKEKLISQCSLVTGVSRRTALEYLTIALVAFNTEEIKENNRVLIKEITDKYKVIPKEIKDKVTDEEKDEEMSDEMIDHALDIARKKSTGDQE